MHLYWSSGKENLLGAVDGAFVTRTILVKPIGEDLVEDARILRFHVTSSLNRNPILRLLLDKHLRPVRLAWRSHVLSLACGRL